MKLRDLSLGGMLCCFSLATTLVLVWTSPIRAIVTAILAVLGWIIRECEW